MKDYRLPENRYTYFIALYRATLKHRVHPGLVYLYLPEIVKRMRLDEEQQLFIAFLNGLTQNPITTIRLMERLPNGVVSTQEEIARFETWFNESWANLQFDTDRLKNKRGTVTAIRSYRELAQLAGSQRALYAGKTYAEAWETASQIHSFGRLSTFSYLEYVNLLGFGPDCDDLMFGDKDGSRSHRNGMLMLHGRDDLVNDKRMPNGFKGYRDLPTLAAQLEERVPGLLEDVGEEASRFTLESCLCCFKNTFFARRYFGVYADMGWERILWYEERGLGQYTKVFRQIREDNLPDWLRWETRNERLGKALRARQFVETGFPYRGEWFM